MASKINVHLSSGYSMPALGYGTWQSKDDDLEEALDNALSFGYRHIDTAWVYENEHIIGKVLKKWLDSGKIKRDELFITTKLPLYGNKASEVEMYLSQSLQKLQLSYVDLYLIHVPIGYFKIGDCISDWKMDPSTDILAIWKEMEKQVDNGKARSIGVSNFNLKQIEKLMKSARIQPVTNQIELHVYLQQKDLVASLKNLNICVTAYSPLGTRGSKKFFEERGIQMEIPDMLEDPVVKTLAEKHNKTPAQILLRHIIQRGLIAIPKSVNPTRIKQNIEIFDFELTNDDMIKLNNLDRNARIVDFKSVFKGCEKHPEYPF